jgi:very-short-patch-repair endonuclease
MLLLYLVSLGYTVIPEKSFGWTRPYETMKRAYRFDFYIPELTLLIELDGPHHFRNMYYASRSHDLQLTIDTYGKMAPALRNGFNFLRVGQADLLKYQDDAKEMIKRALGTLNGDETALVTIALDNRMYDKHIELTYRYYEDANLKPVDIASSAAVVESDSDSDSEVRTVAY